MIYNDRIVFLQSHYRITLEYKTNEINSRGPRFKDMLSYYKTGICCFSAKHAALSREIKEWLARNQNNVSEWSDMSTSGVLFQ